MISNLSLLTDFSGDPKSYSPLTLAFLGDTVYDLFVREMFIVQANRPADQLHRLSAERVRASTQSQAVQTLMQEDFFTEPELSMIRRGRNAHPRHKAKNMSEADYHWATGLESLFGYLYLSGQSERLQSIFREICRVFDEGYAHMGDTHDHSK
ncbi:MAG: ribonuclease III [Clostridia bacterium]|nr:ribonuclease III [Clostridia bacterium]